MSDDLHSVHIVCDEGNEFIQRHPELNSTQAAWGFITWGLLRALYECPHCPQTFRIPRMSRDGVEVLWCPKCEGQWIHRKG